jgi:hypothetical protein
VIHRARGILDEDSLQAELVFLRDVFEQNNHNVRELELTLFLVHRFLSP